MAALNMGINAPRSARSSSAAVTTARTPGMVRASSTSMDTRRAWAMVART